MASTKLPPDQMDISRQTTAGKNGYYVIIGSLQICFGTDSVASSGTVINFARAFSSTPTVLATVNDTNNQTAWVVTKSTTTATLKQLYTGNPLPVAWIAIGSA